MYQRGMMQDQPWSPLDFPSAETRTPGGLFDTVFEESDSGLLILDLDADTLHIKVADANATFERWTGHRRDQLRGTDFFAQLADHPEAIGRVDLRRAVAGLQPMECRIGLTLADGAVRLMQLRIRPVGKARRTLRLLAAFRLASEVVEHALMEARQQREAALNARDAFLARMSHDLRTPLNGILGFSDLMKRELLGPLGQDQYRSYIEDIHAAGQELLGRLDDLLAIKESTARPLPMAEGLFDPVLALSECLEVVDIPARGRRVTITSSIAPGLPQLRGDAEAVRRMVCAVLTNAITAAPVAGLVEVALSVNSRGEMTIAISDDGPAARPEDVAASMGAVGDDPAGVYCNPSRRTVVGLGLARAVIERHGGHLVPTARSRATGQGSRIILTFPLDRLHFDQDEPVADWP